MKYLPKVGLASLVGTTLLVTSLTGVSPAQADSPLTSTDLATAYEDVLEVRVARRWKRAEGFILDFLLGDAPLDQKVAVINALGWDIDHQTNSSRFVQGLARRENLPLAHLTLSRFKLDDRVVLGYLLAMDNYQQMLPLGAQPNLVGKLSPELRALSPEDLLSRAIAQNRNDFTIQFVASLVEAQQSFDRSWCGVYLESALVLDRFPSGARNMREAAVTDAMSYMDAYQPYCQP